MEDPKDSLSFEIGWLKASAVGRFTIVAVLTFFLVLVACAYAVGPGQLIQWWQTESAQIAHEK